MKSLNFSYDEVNDILTVEGVKYSGVLFRQIGGAFPIGRKFLITKRTVNISDDGSINKMVEVYCFNDLGEKND